MEAFRGTCNSSDADDADDVTEDLIVLAPAIFTVPVEEKEARRDALFKAVLDAEEHGLSNEGGKQLQQLV